MKATMKKQQKISSYKDFYAKAVERVRSAEKQKEDHERTEIAKDIEKILDGKQMIIRGNLISS